MEWKARRRPREEGLSETPEAQAEEAHGPPAGKRSAWNGNQQDFILSDLQYEKAIPDIQSGMAFDLYSLFFW
ncbi:hypothetical protein FZC74_01065 [Sutcliffiella horikoshii]|uniref:Uncharacterized protein n=1 Tax=Sutcliffiella horikoshii TaxID=79883 RepID=A0AA95B773_9BACI|nr:hypothetical protein FZC74_01065 [Sutcliffiella horikoshii]